MAGIRLEFAQFGHFDSFEIIRSMTSMVGIADADLPAPIATGVKTMYHVDTTVVEGATYYYRVVAWRDAVSKVSREIQVKASSGDEHWDKVVSLLHFDDAAIDEKGNIWNVTNNPTYTEINGFKSVLLNGINQQLYSTIDLSGTDDITIEIIATLIDGGHGENWARLIHTGQGNQQGSFTMACGFGSDNPACIGTSVWEGDGYGEKAVWSNPVSNNNAHHIAAVRTGSDWKVFIDGIYVWGVTTTQELTRTLFGIGGNNWNVEYFKGYIHTMRITKGVARYTEDFSPPISPFPHF